MGVPPSFTDAGLPLYSLRCPVPRRVSLFDQIHVDDLPVVWQQLGSMRAPSRISLNGKQSGTWETNVATFRRRKKDGDYLWVEQCGCTDVRPAPPPLSQICSFKRQSRVLALCCGMDAAVVHGQSADTKRSARLFPFAAALRACSLACTEAAHPTAALLPNFSFDSAGGFPIHRAAQRVALQKSGGEVGTCSLATGGLVAKRRVDRGQWKSYRLNLLERALALSQATVKNLLENTGEDVRELLANIKVIVSE